MRLPICSTNTTHHSSLLTVAPYCVFRVIKLGLANNILPITFPFPINFSFEFGRRFVFAGRPDNRAAFETSPGAGASTACCAKTETKPKTPPFATLDANREKPKLFFQLFKENNFLSILRWHFLRKYIVPFLGGT